MSRLLLCRTLKYFPSGRLLTTQASRRVSSIDGSELSVEISEAAQERLLKLGQPIRVEVESGGCHGFQYHFSIEKSPTTEDIVFERNGAKVVIDEVSLPLLTGSTVDWKSELIGSAFCISGNPRAKSGCGCGVSFDIQPTNDTNK